MKNLLHITLILVLILSITGCSNNSIQDINLSTPSNAVNNELSQEEIAEKVRKHAIFVHFDYEIDVLENEYNEFDYAYDWDLNFNDDITTEEAFYDYLYFLSGYYPVYAELLGDGAVDDRFAVWEGKGYTIGTIIAEDGESAKMYLDYSDNNLKRKILELKEEKDEQSKKIKEERELRLNEFDSEVKEIEKDAKIYEILKNYPLYACSYIEYIDNDTYENPMYYNIKNDELDKLIKLLLNNSYKELSVNDNIFDDIIKDVESSSSYIFITDSNDSRLGDIVNPVYLTEFTLKDGSMKVYVITTEDTVLELDQNKDLENYINELNEKAKENKEND